MAVEMEMPVGLVYEYDQVLACLRN